MNKISGIFFRTKRHKFVLTTFILSCVLFAFDAFYPNRAIVERLLVASVLGLTTDIVLFLILRNDINDTFFYPLFILPFAYTISFSMLYILFPARFLSRFLITALYAFGLYSLFLTQNIFAVATIRTINLLRSARVISFILTNVSFFTIIAFYLIHVIPIIPNLMFLMPILVFVVACILTFQLFWFYSLDTKMLKEITVYSVFNALALSEIVLIISIWPVNPTIYAISLTGIFYCFSGLSHTWFEKKLFKGVLWEYVWVGFLSILILILFSRWGI